MFAKTIMCTKCGSDRVDNFTKDKPLEPKAISMDEFAETVGQIVAIPAVKIYTQMVLLCKDCGYRKEYII